MNGRRSGSENGDREKRIQLGQENEIMGDSGHTSGDTGRTSGETEHTSSDAERVRDALQEHRWPEAGEALMARLRAIPVEAEARVEAGADVGSPQVSHPSKAGRSPLSRPTGRLEALGAIAIVAAVVLVILRGGGDQIAPADESEQGIADAKRTAEAGALATARAEAGSGESVDGAVSEESYAEGRSSAMGSVEPGDAAGAGDGSGAVSAGPPPMPPEGTRLYASVEELLAEPPPPGEMVWVDAYHGELIAAMSIPDMSFLVTPSKPPCRTWNVPPLLDRPRLVQLAAFGTSFGIVQPDSENEAFLIAAGLEDDGSVSVYPHVRLPRRGRLVLRLGDKAFEHCADAGRIAIVERVAHVFEEKTDWTAMEAHIRAAASAGTASGSTHVASPDGGADTEIGASEIDIPEGLEISDIMDDSIGVEDVNFALAMPELPDHPIIFQSFLPEHPLYEALLTRVQSGLAEPVMPVYSQRWIDGLVGDAALNPTSLDFVIEGLFSDAGDLIPIGTSEVSAFTVVDDVVYRISTTPPADPLQAQPLLWWLETVVDRFRVPEADGAGIVGVGPSSSPHGLIGTIDVGFEPAVVAAAGDVVVIGGVNGLAVATLDPGGRPESMRTYRPGSPSLLGVVRDADNEVVAKRLTRGDVGAARALLAEPGAWRVHAVAVGRDYAFAAIESPPSTGIVALHVIDLSGDELVATNVVRLPAEPDDSGTFAVNDLVAIRDGFDRLLVASSMGIFTIDAWDPTEVVVAPIAPGLETMAFGLGVASEDGSAGAKSQQENVLPGATVTPVLGTMDFGLGAASGDGRAWATSPLLDRGGLIALTLDVTDAAGARSAGRLAADAAFLDIATDGRSAFVTTGSADDHLRAFDVSGDGEPRALAALRLDADNVLRLALLGNRLVVAATNLPGESAYPPPSDRPELGHAGLLVYDVSQPAAPALVETISLPGSAVDVAVSGDLLFAAVGTERQVRLYRLMGIEPR